MNSLPIIDGLSGFAPNTVLIGDGQPADRVFAREEFVLLCNFTVHCDLLKRSRRTSRKELRGHGTRSRADPNTRFQSAFIRGIVGVKAAGRPSISTHMAAGPTAQSRSPSPHSKSYAGAQSSI
jgi:hypothetical protein